MRRNRTPPASDAQPSRSYRTDARTEFPRRRSLTLSEDSHVRGDEGRTGGCSGHSWASACRSPGSSSSPTSTSRARVAQSHVGARVAPSRRRRNSGEVHPLSARRANAIAGGASSAQAFTEIRDQSPAAPIADAVEESKRQPRSPQSFEAASGWSDGVARGPAAPQPIEAPGPRQGAVKRLQAPGRPVLNASSHPSVTFESCKPV